MKVSSGLDAITELEYEMSPHRRQTADVERSHHNRSLELYLIRHGETAWTVSGRHTGLTDIPLTAFGEDEVRKWGHRLTHISFARVLTSPLQRAQRTCELVGLAAYAEIEPDLVEWDYGDYEGLRSVDICQERPGWNVFRDGCPNGELPAQVSARADCLIARMGKTSGKFALFAHGHFGAVLIARWIGLPIAQARHFHLATAGLSILANHPHHSEVPVIERLNATPQCAILADVDHRATMEERAIQRWENEGGEPSEASELRLGNSSMSSM